MTLDEAVAVVADPKADPAVLAEIAYEYPQARSAVAAHPQAYPDLLAWIAAAGDATQAHPAGAEKAIDEARTLGGSQAVERSRTPIASWVLIGAVIAADFLYAWPVSLLLGYSDGGFMVFNVLAALVIGAAILLLPGGGRRRVVGAVLAGGTLIVKTAAGFAIPHVDLGPQDAAAFAQWNLWSWAVASGLLVLAWLIARGRSPLSYSVAVLMVLVQAGADAFFDFAVPLLQTALHWPVATVMPVFAVTGLLLDLIMVGACFVAAASFWGTQPGLQPPQGAQP